MYELELCLSSVLYFVYIPPFPINPLINVIIKGVSHNSLLLHVYAGNLNRVKHTYMRVLGTFAALGEP